MSLRIQKSARYYINALNGVLTNNTIFNTMLNPATTKQTPLNLFHTLSSLGSKNKGTIQKQFLDRVNDKIVELQKSRLLIDIILGIAQLYAQSTKAAECFRDNLPLVFQTTLKKCLTDSLLLLRDCTEANVLWQYLEGKHDTIFRLFNLPLEMKSVSVQNLTKLNNK